MQYCFETLFSDKFVQVFAKMLPQNLFNSIVECCWKFYYAYIQFCAEIYVTWLDLTKAYLLSNKQEVKSAETCVLAFFYVNSNALFIIIFCFCYHTIRKSSKMDGAKYIPNFAFKWW